jgi:hypothetical protein
MTEKMDHSYLTSEDRATILNLVVNPDAWINPRIAEAASKIASADPVEHHRRVATLMLEAILALLELDSTEPTPDILVAHLLNPQIAPATLDSVKAKGRLSPALVPISMVDRLTALQITPRIVRELQFARVVAHLRAVTKEKHHAS